MDKSVVHHGVIVVNRDHHSEENLNETNEKTASDVVIDYTSPLLRVEAINFAFEVSAVASNTEVKYTEGEADEQDQEGSGDQRVQILIACWDWLKIDRGIS